MTAFKKLVGTDTHQVAKSRAAEFLGAYRARISEVQSVCSDSALCPEFTPALREWS